MALELPNCHVDSVKILYYVGYVFGPINIPTDTEEEV
jgi:hypothetical protein